MSWQIPGSIYRSIGPEHPDPTPDSARQDYLDFKWSYQRAGWKREITAGIHLHNTSHRRWKPIKR